jgi:hypothetical protein
MDRPQIQIVEYNMKWNSIVKIHPNGRKHISSAADWFAQIANQLLDNLLFIRYLFIIEKEIYYLWRLYRRLDKGLFLK